MWFVKWQVVHEMTGGSWGPGNFGGNTGLCTVTYSCRQVPSPVSACRTLSASPSSGLADREAHGRLHGLQETKLSHQARTLAPGFCVGLAEDTVGLSPGWDGCNGTLETQGQTSSRITTPQSPVGVWRQGRGWSLECFIPRDPREEPGFRQQQLCSAEGGRDAGSVPHVTGLQTGNQVRSDTVLSSEFYIHFSKESEQ